jgi:hypothetical protein
LSGVVELRTDESGSEPSTLKAKYRQTEMANWSLGLPSLLAPLQRFDGEGTIHPSATTPGYVPHRRTVRTLTPLMLRSYVSPSVYCATILSSKAE